MAALFACFSFLVAVLVGAYRSFCIYKQEKYFGADTPMIWRFFWFRTLSWLVVATASIFAALAVGQSLGWGWVGKIALVATLGLRWSVSLVVATKVFMGRI